MGEDEKASPTGPSRPKRARISQNTNAKPKQVQAAEMKQKVAQALLKQKKENEPVLLKWDKEQWEAWKTCEKASAVLDTAFLALKTPLSTIYEAEVGEEHIFTVDMFAQEETKAGRFCAMVVNAVADQKEYLYNTKEIYDDWDMTLEPLPIEDDQKNELDPQLFRFVAPSRAQVQNFIRTVRNQLEDDPLSKIGVVSTFGYNRVGVLIISYLVEAKQMSLLDALALFAKSRPPGVYSKSCLLALQRRYALNVSVPVPAAPEWDKAAPKLGAAYPKSTELPALTGPKKKEDKPKPPAPWQRGFSKRENRDYFFNPVTKKSVWKIEDCS